MWAPCGALAQSYSQITWPLSDFAAAPLALPKLWESAQAFCMLPVVADLLFPICMLESHCLAPSHHGPVCWPGPSSELCYLAFLLSSFKEV